MFKDISKYTWFSFVPALVLGAVTVALLVVGEIPLSYLFLTLIGWSLIHGLGVATGYHRVFSHNTHPNLATWKENIILFFGALSGQGSSITWKAIHTYHHRYSDQKGDPHSPIVYTKWYAFFTWSRQITESNPGINLKYAVNLLRKPNHLWFHRHSLKLLWGVPIALTLVFGWKVALMLNVLPTAMALTFDNLVNVFGHVKAFIGYRNFDTSDQSQNNWLFGYFGWGQGWHNNHHHDPAAFDYGVGISGKWWEFDPCRLYLPFLNL